MVALIAVVLITQPQTGSHTYAQALPTPTLAPVELPPLNMYATYVPEDTMPLGEDVFPVSFVDFESYQVDQTVNTVEMPVGTLCMLALGPGQINTYGNPNDVLVTSGGTIGNIVVFAGNRPVVVSGFTPGEAALTCVFQEQIATSLDHLNLLSESHHVANAVDFMRAIDGDGCGEEGCLTVNVYVQTTAGDFRWMATVLQDETIEVPESYLNVSQFCWTPDEVSEDGPYLSVKEGGGTLIDAREGTITFAGSVYEGLVIIMGTTADGTTPGDLNTDILITDVGGTVCVENYFTTDINLMNQRIHEINPQALPTTLYVTSLN